MIVSDSKLQAASRGFKALFFQSLEQDPSNWRAMHDMLAMTVRSKNKVENHAWLGDNPGLEEWLGPRSLGKLRELGFSITNKKYAGGLEVDAEDIEDDNLGIVKPRIQSLAQQVWYHKLSLVVALINNGTSATCYDGQYFFDTDHADYDSGTQSNTAGTTALNATNFAAKRAAMMKLKNDRGRVMGVYPTHLWCVPELEDAALEICTAERNSSGATNIWKGKCDILVIPYLSATDAWGFLDLSKPFRPFITQNKRDPRWMEPNGADSHDVFNYDIYKYGVDYRGAAGYGLWQLMTYFTES